MMVFFFVETSLYPVSVAGVDHNNPVIAENLGTGCLQVAQEGRTCISPSYDLKTHQDISWAGQMGLTDLEQVYVVVTCVRFG
jgi:hypothetical protein